jgi:hypothetical protein
MKKKRKIKSFFEMPGVIDISVTVYIGESFLACRNNQVKSRLGQVRLESLSKTDTKSS